MTRHDANDWDRSSELVADRFRIELKAAHPTSAAEFYLVAGRAVRKGLRRGLTHEVINRCVGLPVDECMRALRYAESPDWLKLRALVEDWSWDTIKDPLQTQAPSQRDSLHAQ